MDTKSIATSMAAFSDKKEDLLSALGLLYIRSNSSGRNIFRSKFPDVSEYLFGSELIKYDNEGTNNLERKRELEVLAGDRRISLKATIAELVEKSADKGILQFEYVGQVIDEYGAAISRYLYAEDVIERVRPGVLAKYKDDIENSTSEQEEAQSILDNEISEKQNNDKMITEEKVSLSDSGNDVGITVVDENLDNSDIKPIETRELAEDVINKSSLVKDESKVDEISISPETQDIFIEETVEAKLEELSVDHIRYSELFNNIAKPNYNI